MCQRPTCPTLSCVSPVRKPGACCDTCPGKRLVSTGQFCPILMIPFFAPCVWCMRIQDSLILDSTPWILDSTRWIPDSWYWIPVFVNGTEFQLLWDPDSLKCIPDSKAQGSGFHKQKFPLHGATFSFSIYLLVVSKKYNGLHLFKSYTQ